MIDERQDERDGGGAERDSDLAGYRRSVQGEVLAALLPDRWRRWRAWLDLPVLLVFITLMTLLFAPPGQSVHELPEIDSLAIGTIRADRDFLVEDRRATELRRQAAHAEIVELFDYDSDLYFALGERVRRAVATLKKPVDAAVGTNDRRMEFSETLGVSVNAGIFSLIQQLKEPDDISAALIFFLNLGLDRMVATDRSQLPSDGSLVVRDLTLGSESRLFRTMGIFDLRSLRRLITARAVDAPYGSARIIRSWILEAAHKLVAGNLVPNRKETERRREQAVADIAPVFVRIHAGEVIQRRGDRVTDAVRERIQLLNQGLEGRMRWAETAAVAALLSGIVLLGYGFFRQGRSPLKFSRKSSYMTLTIFAGAAALAVASYYAGLGLAEGFDLDPGVAAYFVPLPLVTVLLALMMDARTSLLVGVGLTLFVAYRVDGDLWLVTYYVVGVLIAGIAARSSRRRSDLLKTGLAIGLAQAALVPILIVLSGQNFADLLIPLLAAALVSGTLVALGTLGALPLLEYLFDEMTELRMLEIAAGDNPLLKELALTSPGTYHHSVMVANLAEAAAEAIGASGLQCRVMALYHDIGKIKRPNYFSENQRAGDNLHDRLPPERSARIIFDHVRDGLAMARQNNLGRSVIEGIAQHHGTSLLLGFYNKALSGPGGNQTDEELFRYPGQKPESREAGVLMLADSTEAATRALKDPAPADLRRRVSAILEALVADGQLDDCDLTMKDLVQVEDAFARVLTLGVYHNRIEYPSAASEAAVAGESSEDDGSQRVRFLRRLVDRTG